MPTAFAQTVEAHFAELTPTPQRMASYMLAHLERRGLATADQIAQQTATSGISVGCFLGSVGYRNLDDLKRELRGAQGRPWMITDRLDEYRCMREQLADARRHGKNGKNGENGENLQTSALTHSLQLVETIQHVYQLAQSPMFARIAERVSQADAVYILGIQSTRGTSNAFYGYLECIRPRVLYSDGMSGSYVDSLNSEFAAPYLVIADTRAYPVIARRYSEAPAHRGGQFHWPPTSIARWLVNSITTRRRSNRCRPVLGLAGAAQLSVQPADDYRDRCSTGGRDRRTRPSELQANSTSSISKPLTSGI
ncbi:DNA-binding MurR/RpiR family transcriptional regulator [Paraburkholderia sp. JPY681]|nr:DNA-binding MurR/RpiR family transcriptional regulator [Paraburkholderia atlantica]